MTSDTTLSKTEQAVHRRLAGSEINADALAIAYSIHSCASTLRNHIERTILNKHDVTWTAWIVMWVVWAWDEIEAGTAAKEASISRSTLTGVAGTLADKGLVIRKKRADDGRRVVLKLTDKGTELLQGLFVEVNQQELAWCAELSPEEMSQLVGLLQRLSK